MPAIDPLYEACTLLKTVEGRALDTNERQLQAIALAEMLLLAARAQQTKAEQQQQKQLADLMADPQGKLFTTQMTDQCFRSTDAARVADQLRYLMQVWGIPRYLAPRLRVQLFLFKALSYYFPTWCVPQLRLAVRQQVATVVLPAEAEPLNDYLQRRYRAGVRVNLNYLGEAILGEEEAAKRLKGYLKALENPAIEYISVKVSTLSSQLNLLAWDETLEHLAIPLRRLYRAAAKHTFRRPDGQTTAKFVNLDMEEYRDLLLTVRLFQKVLMEPPFLHCEAGIVLQSYLPDSFALQQELTTWAQARCQQGGAPIKIRLVKGANLAMEQVEASLYGWSQAPYTAKWESDANFKRMLLFGCQAEHAAAVHLGVGSHNLLDIAYALLLRAERQLQGAVTFEMLEGMAPALQRVIQQVAGDLLLYSPAATAAQFHTAVAYLMRRLDENTAPENFLRAFFDLQPGSAAWKMQVDSFKQACEAIDVVGAAPRRRQNRSEEREVQVLLDQPFVNAATTDWSLPANRAWIAPYLKRYYESAVVDIPLVIDGLHLHTAEHLEGYDPSRPGHVLYRYQQGDADHADRAVRIAHEAQKSWWQRSPRERSQCLAQVAAVLRAKRGDLIAVMVADAGKTVYEADIEVSEAIDFCEYYRRSAQELFCLQDISWQARGTVLVAPPWNFPCSIAVGGIAAALAAGNAVIYKPPPQTIWVAWLVAQAFWAGGVAQGLLQFVTGDDATLGSALIQNPLVDVVLLTGATATAQLLLKLRPGLHLSAETGGKNSIIVTALADRDLAIRAIVHSAFGHAGQKCSACSLLICLPEIYEDLHFRQQLRDAAASLPVGSAWESRTALPPLIGPAEHTLLTELTTLGAGEEWLLAPKQQATNPQLWGPGIKLGVTKHSTSYRQELFGPVLSVMRANDLSHALELANGTPYGLTAGIHTLDVREQSHWLKNIMAGNCYINRTITGAIVQRQPFGGCKASSFGSGAKAGGPNYLIQLMHAEQSDLPLQRLAPPPLLTPLMTHLRTSDLSLAQQERWRASLGSYTFFWRRYFSQGHDPSHVLGEDNSLQYCPRRLAVLRMQANDDPFAILCAIAAALTVDCPLEISGCATHLNHPLLKGAWHRKYPAIQFIEESLPALCSRLMGTGINGIRFLATPPAAEAAALAAIGCVTNVLPVVANGRLELLSYLREVVISHTYHRYGYLGSRDRPHYLADPTEAGCCFGQAAPMGCCGSGECDQM